MDERLQRMREAVARNWAIGMLNGVAKNPDFGSVMVAGFGEVTRDDLEMLAQSPAEQKVRNSL